MRWKPFLTGMIVVLAAVILIAATQLTSLKVFEDLEVVGSTTTTGVVTTEGLTSNGLVQFDSSLYFGTSTPSNGGIYVKVQNKAGKTLRAGEVAQWDNTLVTGEEIDGDSNSLAVLVADFNAEGGYQYVLWYEDGSGTPTQDSLQLTGIGFRGETIVEILVLNGDNDSVWSTNAFTSLTDAQIPTSTPWTSSVTTLTKFSAYRGVVQSAVLADNDSTLVRRDCGVIYPSAIADNAVGWMLIRGWGKILASTLDGSLTIGAGLDVDADSAGTVSLNVPPAGGNGHLNQIAVVMQPLETSGHTIPQLIQCYFDPR